MSKIKIGQLREFGDGEIFLVLEKNVVQAKMPWEPTHRYTVYSLQEKKVLSWDAVYFEVDTVPFPRRKKK